MAVGGVVMQHDPARLRLFDSPSRLVALAFLLFALGGCSISNSSETISDSVSSPFRWSSGSSGSSSGADEESEEAIYRRDVSRYAEGFARAGGDPDAFRTGVRGLAQARGITNWEEDPLTCSSIGLGLQLAQLEAGRASRFANAMVGGHPRCIEAMRGGYESSP